MLGAPGGLLTVIPWESVRGQRGQVYMGLTLSERSLSGSPACWDQQRGHGTYFQEASNQIRSHT